MSNSDGAVVVYAWGSGWHPWLYLFWGGSLLGLISWFGCVHRPHNWNFRLMSASMFFFGALYGTTSLFLGDEQLPNDPLPQNSEAAQLAASLIPGRVAQAFFYIFLACVHRMWCEALIILRPTEAQSSIYWSKILNYSAMGNLVFAVLTLALNIWLPLSTTTIIITSKELILYILFAVCMTRQTLSMSLALCGLRNLGARNAAVLDDDNSSGRGPCALLCSRRSSSASGRFTSDDIDEILARKILIKLLRIVSVAMAVALAVLVRLLLFFLEAWSVFSSGSALGFQSNNSALSDFWVTFALLGTFLPALAVWLLTLRTSVIDGCTFLLTCGQYEQCSGEDVALKRKGYDLDQLQGGDRGGVEITPGASSLSTPTAAASGSGGSEDGASIDDSLSRLEGRQELLFSSLMNNPRSASMAYSSDSFHFDVTKFARGRAALFATMDAHIYPVPISAEVSQGSIDLVNGYDYVQGLH